MTASRVSRTRQRPVKNEGLTSNAYSYRFKSRSVMKIGRGCAYSPICRVCSLLLTCLIRPRNTVRHAKVAFRLRMTGGIERDTIPFWEAP